MTSQVCNARMSLTAAALEQNSRQLDTVGNSSWRLQPRDAVRCFVNATLEGNWLVLTAHDSLGLIADAAPRDLLQRCAGLPGFAKFALMPDGSLQLRAELPLIEEANLAGRIRETCEGFESAFTVYNFSKTACVPETPANKTDLKRLCTEAGWSFVERGPEKLLVELESPEGFRQATMVPTADGVHLSCELVSCGLLGGESREAIAAFLLSVSGVVRLARAALVADVAQLEVAFLAPPCAAEISSALESLSVGCSLCGEEIKMLQDPAIARQFLALRERPAEMVA
jgi:hypothetical protein